MGAFVLVAGASSDSMFFDASDGLSLLQLRTNTVVADDKYCEGIIAKTVITGGTHTQDIDEAKRKCDAVATCKGIMLWMNDYWYNLGTKRDGDAYAKGTNWGGQAAQKSVLVKNCEDALVLPASNCDTEYVEGQVDNAQVGNMGATSQPEAETRCNRDPTCLGIWYHRSNRKWHCYFPTVRPGTYSYRAGWNGWQADVNVQFVKVKSCVATTTTSTTTLDAPNDAAAAVGDPHLTFASGNTQDLCCEGGTCHVC